jgi:hypothetical protein
LFVERLARAYPDRKIELATDPAAARVLLAIDRADSRSIAARLVVMGPEGSTSGEPAATAIADKSLARAQIAAFLDALIANGPKP